MIKLLQVGLLALLGTSTAAHAVGPRFSSHASTTTVSVSNKAPAGGELINVSAIVRAQALGVFYGRPIAGEDTGGTVEFFANGSSIGKVRIGRANAPTIGSVRNLDQGCYAAIRDPVACTYVFYYGREITLTVPYQAPPRPTAVTFTATFSGDSNFSKGSTSTSVTLEPLSAPAVYAISRMSNPVLLDTLEPSGGYQTYRSQTSTAHAAVGTSPRFQFQLADFDGDGIEDLFFFNRSQTGSGTTEVHILKGPEHKTFLRQTGTALGDTGTDNQWKFLLGDYDRDGNLDIYAVKKYGTGGKLEIHVLDGATGYQTFLAQHATPAAGPGNSTEFDFGLGDYDGDGLLDFYTINKNGLSGKTEVHVLSGASGFQNYIAHISTGLGMTGSGSSWVFGVSDYNLDGRPDVYAIRKESANVEIHVLDGSTGFSTSLLQMVTPITTQGIPEGLDVLVGGNLPAR